MRIFADPGFNVFGKGMTVYRKRTACRNTCPVRRLNDETPQLTHFLFQKA